MTLISAADKTVFNVTQPGFWNLEKKTRIHLENMGFLYKQKDFFLSSV